MGPIVLKLSVLGIQYFMEQKDEIILAPVWCTFGSFFGVLDFF